MRGLGETLFYSVAGGVVMGKEGTPNEPTTKHGYIQGTNHTRLMMPLRYLVPGLILHAAPSPAMPKIDRPKRFLSVSMAGSRAGRSGCACGWVWIHRDAIHRHSARVCHVIHTGKPGRIELHGILLF